MQDEDNGRPYRKFMWECGGWFCNNWGL